MMALAMTVFCLGTAAVVAADSGAADAGVPGAFFFESFGFGWQDRWHYSRYKKYEGRFETVEPQEYQDTAIQMPAGNQHYGMTAQLPEPLLPSDGIVVQYEVQFAQGHTCGGAYLKLLSQTPEELKPEQLKPKTPFSIMFGPDRCGSNRRVRAAFLFIGQLGLYCRELRQLYKQQQQHMWIMVLCVMQYTSTCKHVCHGLHNAFALQSHAHMLATAAACQQPFTKHGQCAWTPGAQLLLPVRTQQPPAGPLHVAHLQVHALAKHARSQGAEALAAAPGVGLRGRQQLRHAARQAAAALAALLLLRLLLLAFKQP
eukprot:GHRQ01033179.1.p1 GENE.GHRQ01033179.1~~GHRQ01033179.1.p1  ORF type:complete len:314 (+),score=83.07 GHRQ01033179.1:491-1432(+)